MIEIIKLHLRKKVMETLSLGVPKIELSGQRHRGAVDKVFSWNVLFKWSHLEVAGSIPTTVKNNKEYLL